jgi:hypothetical protein
MQRKIIYLGAGITFLGLVSAAAFAQSDTSMGALAAPAAGMTESFCGTVVKLTEGGCIGVKSSMVGGPLYEISSANPKPALGMLITGSGTTGGVSMCMQGVHLTDVKWHKAAVCGLTKKKTM